MKKIFAFLGAAMLLAVVFGASLILKSEKLEGEWRVERIERVFLPRPAPSNIIRLMNVDGVSLVGEGATIAFQIRGYSGYQNEWERTQYISVEPQHALRVIQDVPKTGKSWLLYRNGVYKRRTLEQVIEDLTRGVFRRELHEIEFGYIEIHVPSATVIREELESGKWRYYQGFAL